MERTGWHRCGGYRVRVPSPSRLLRPLGLLVVAALVVTGCSAPKHQASPRADATPDAQSAPEPGLARFYAQTLAWQECDQGECARLEVPLDYADLEAGSVELAVARQRATGGDRIGSLLLNPGGPGGSGVDFVEQAATTVSEDVQARYDLVGFDPRGVQASTPAVTCVPADELDELLAFDPDLTTDEGIAEAADMFGAFSQECLERTGPVFGHVDTISAARDMDVLRAVLGDEQLHYLGYSYGTQLGATYAGLFPERVGRVVLDGAVDPTLTAEEATAAQAVGFENALRAYVADCQGGSRCPLTGSVDDGMRQITALLDRAYESPLRTGTDRPLTRSLAFTGIAVTLYSQEYWTYLTSALTSALDGDGSILLTLSDAYYDRREDGSYGTNQTEAFWSIGCLDPRASADLADMRADAEAIMAAAPTVGEFFTFGGTRCAQWSVPEVGGLDDFSAAGAAPIVVIGTTNDPATPYEQAQALAKILDSGVLLTYEGEGHTAYGRSNDCIGDAVDGYLLDGEVPGDGTTC
ncbi:TAP domain protein [Cellulomonas gilvus ATCC 13127]|uniref:TAP domain protein n=1 Tax=Cellulomonas gilvus (strain ATCC 13127 / NRRL B-14078) TaxID=593907 RepID=F8A474_CELGA|nr:TAP domain protein [Cellulomonas gilvus ATCC 13127]